MIVYAPLARIAANRETPYGAALCWWASVGLAKDQMAMVPANDAGNESEIICLRLDGSPYD